jgi:glycerophosphoryl diester phosphodiesterase
MNAVREHARLHGDHQAPVFSPWHVMLDDGNPDTFVENRSNPPAGSGLVPASSEIFNVQSLQQAGPGKDHADAERRWKNAETVRFNIETKINPRTDADDKGNIFAARTVGPELFAQTLAGTIEANDLEDRADIQSFDFRTLLVVQEQFPQIRTVYLFGDLPKFDDPTIPGSDDGTNLQPQGESGNTPWLAGLFWPYRVTALDHLFRLDRSGGFEGMALTVDGRTLLPLLEKRLDNVGTTLLIHEFEWRRSGFEARSYSDRLTGRASP